MAARGSAGKLLATSRHAIFFFLMFVIGAVLLAFAKVLPIPSYFLLSQGTISVIVAFVLMLGYGLCITVVPATKLRLDVAADNLYYLGFLYTLSSLAFALTVDDVDKILSNFGVAIASTLIGIAARVSLNQLRVDPNDVEEASRIELSEATRRVRRELDDTILQLSSFRNLSMQAMTEGFEDIEEKVDKISTNLLASIETTVERSSASIELLVSGSTEATNEMLNNIGSVIESSEDIIAANGRMSKQTNALVKALESLESHYSNTAFLDDKVISALTAQLDDIKENFLKTISNNNKNTNKRAKPGARKVKGLNLETGADSADQSSGVEGKYTMYKGKVIYFGNAEDGVTTSNKTFGNFEEAKKWIDQDSFFKRFLG